MHYWAGRMLKDEFANTAEDAVNIILKVCTLRAHSIYLVAL